MEKLVNAQGDCSANYGRGATECVRLVEVDGYRNSLGEGVVVLRTDFNGVCRGRVMVTGVANLKALQSEVRRALRLARKAGARSGKSD